MFLIIYSLTIGLLLLAGILLLALKKLLHLGRVLIMLAASGISFAAWFIGAIFLMSNVHQNFYLWMLLIFLLLLMMLLGLILWGGFKTKLLSIPVCSMIALCLVVTLGFHSWTVIQDRIPTVGEGGDLLSQYSPFEESMGAELEEPAALQLQGLDLPKLDGATAMYPIYSAFFKAVYTDQYESHITCSTTTMAYDNIITGEADIIFVGGPSEDQKKAAEEAGVELVYTPIGREAFVFFVNSKNPINDITLEQIKGIYSGEITEWDALNVEKLGKIRAFQRDEGSGSQTALQTLMGDTPLMDPPREDVVTGMGGIISKTADYKNYQNAIGYSFRFYSTEMADNDQIKLLSVNGVAPTLENIENGTYPIASEFYAVTRRDADENAKAFLDWMLSEEGQELIEKTGYTPLNK